MAVQVDQAAQEFARPTASEPLGRCACAASCTYATRPGISNPRLAGVGSIQSNEREGLQGTHWRSVPDVKSSVMKLTVIVLLSSQES